MKRSALLLFSAFLAAAHVRAQSLLDAISTPERTMAAGTQTFAGTWLLELRRPGAPAGQPPLPNLIISHPDGTVIGSTADGAQTSAHGVWVRVGDRKFLQTMYVFNFNESRVLATITKVRINVLLSADGQTVRGTTEVVVLDRDGRVMATIPGGTYSGVRLNPEKPGDFDAFQSEQ